MGIFNVCPDDDSSLNIEANKTRIENQETEGNAKFSGLDHNYTEYVICNDTERFIELLLDAALDEKHFFEPKIVDGKKLWKDQKMMYLYCHVPPEMSKLAESILSFSKEIKLCAPQTCDDRVDLKPIETQANELKNLLERFKWYDVTMILLKSSDYHEENEYWTNYYNKSIETIFQMLEKRTI